jgi:diaminohydroxyphosphoribosylaminopyrimidine deaminase / 5-amino-6-(5-phosphoribosylamino)uracil reductase
MATEVESAVMRRAIALSAAGLGRTSPNPPVGCVLLGSGGGIVGEGYHERKGEAHAEAQALAAAGPLAAGATAVVTLEPCNHHGRTPPCRQALVEAGVRRVVVAVIDPTSRGAGGVAELRRAGVEVETGVLEAEALIVLGGWLAALETRRPFITWPYLAGDHGIEALPWHAGEALALRLTADAALRADGTVREALSGSHGAGILDLKDQPPPKSAAEAAAALYEGGVRHLVLDGGLDVAAPFLASRLVDRVVAHLPLRAASMQPSADLPWPLMPDGFAIAGVSRTERLVRIDGRPEALRSRMRAQTDRLTLLSPKAGDAARRSHLVPQLTGAPRIPRERRLDGGLVGLYAQNTAEVQLRGAPSIPRRLRPAGEPPMSRRPPRFSRRSGLVPLRPDANQWACRVPAIGPSLT